MEDSYELTTELVEAARRNEYMYQSDPLFFEWQRSEKPEDKQAWIDKVQEIKEANPYPEKLAE